MMLGCVEKISTKLSAPVGFFASVSFSSSLLLEMLFACSSAASAAALSGFAMKRALNAVLSFFSSLRP